MKLQAWPVGEQWRGAISQEFGVNAGDYPATGGHMGVDWAVPARTPIYAVADGEVWIAEDDAYNSGFGSAIVIAHDAQPGRGATQFSLYGHLWTQLVRAGDQVRAGQQIGTSGGFRGDPGQGNSTGAHLHLQLRVSGARLGAVPFSSWGKIGAVDPLPLLRAIGTEPGPGPVVPPEPGLIVPGPVTTTASAGLYLRMGPGKNYGSDGLLPMGTVLEAVEIQGEWVKVVRRLERWVSRAWVK